MALIGVASAELQFLGKLYRGVWLGAGDGNRTHLRGLWS